MTDPRRAQAARLRGQGLTFAQIALEVNRSASTVSRWLRPGSEERSRELSRRWKERNRDKVRAQDKARKRVESFSDRNPLKPRPCRCENPWRSEDGCVRCGRTLP